ncbi:MULTISPECIES: aminotransferase class V-fold PLP-dependent enzyme [Aminobacterium]|uniref:aminotransferase class V-fold PLP-dependent enzyme n=1 Tax=Aminobacterium TaxID=81466 RepID=UPI00257E900E|nr:aminotransferase class V-fold PLP-dependent enzyme [Aminobacterium sp. UBA4987]
MSIYLNNAATSWPKPHMVPQAMYDFMVNSGANLARGTAAKRDLGTMDLVLNCRELLAEFFHGYEDADPRYVTFTSNITESLNIVLKGYLKPGMKVLTSSMEHNASMRPLRRLEQRGVHITVLPCDMEGVLSLRDLDKVLKEDSFDLMIITHASNVCGTVQDISGIARLCREAGVPLVVDSAQTAGVLPIHVSDLGLAALCFTGHKGLMGPQGTGGIIWKPDFAEKVEWFIEGGTGSFSHLELQPDSMPDKFEAGTPNLPGIAGLRAALQWLVKEGPEKIHARETQLGLRFIEGVKKIPGVILAGKQTMEGRLPVFPLNFTGRDHAIVAAELVERAGIETRPGLHCAPVAHKTLGTDTMGGALRISIGYFNTEEDIDCCLETLASILAEPLKA